MPRRTDINHVLVIGSGPIVIGQACEFDYSGTQACRVLRERGHPGVADQLESGDDHDRPGVRRRHLHRADQRRVRGEGAGRPGGPGVPGRRGAGHPGRADRAEHRHRAGRAGRAGEVRRRADRRGHRRPSTAARTGRSSRTWSAPSAATCPRSAVCHTMDEVRAAVADLGLPVVVRPSFTMGGLGSGMAYTLDDLERIARRRAGRVAGLLRSRGTGGHGTSTPRC